ncbi:MAG: ABC transporter substrate-binding protein [Anaerolineae bacterium]|nr:ABC transporter substrate-binding protein [Anaerolineae bacterium]
MKRSILSLMFILVLLLFSAAGLAQDMSEGDLVYPFQYADLDAYAAATGNSIDMWGEAPMLAEQVAAGDLPPVEERLPAQPAVVQPLESIGEYGGELAGPTTNPTCCGWDVLEMRLQKLLTIDTDLTSIIPNIARAYEVSDDQTTFTFHLREGHRWSDGEAFTTDDFRFYFEDVLGNTELTPNPGGPWVLNGELPQVDIIDETTIRMTYPEARPTLLISIGSEVNHRGFRPQHYFAQYHADYNADANDLAAELGFEDWVQMFNAKMTPYNNTWNLGSETDAYSPTLNTFVFASEDAFGNKYYERNPYYFKVDTAGNQLPYTDTLRRILVEDLQVQDLKAISGEYSHYGWGTLLSFPTYRENEEAGGYRTALAEYSRGNEYSVMFNFTTPNLPLREIFWDIRFRQAMSVAINRDEINELVYFGLANASANSPVPSSLFFEDWMPGHYAQYDPDLANQLLDEMGLDQRDGDGFRLRPDGETLFLNFQVSVPEDSWRQMGELITSYWNEVGVKTSYKLIGNDLYRELRDGNQVDLAAWGTDMLDIGEVANGLANMRPRWGARASGRLWQDWLVEYYKRLEVPSDEAMPGEEPPQEIKDLWAAGDAFLDASYGSDEWLELGKEFYRLSMGGLYQIGTIQRPPQPLLFKTNLKNTPPNDTTGQWSWTYRQWVMFMPEQWYFEGGSN